MDSIQTTHTHTPWCSDLSAGCRKGDNLEFGNFKHTCLKPHFALYSTLVWIPTKLGRYITRVKVHATLEVGSDWTERQNGGEHTFDIIL